MLKNLTIAATLAVATLATTPAFAGADIPAIREAKDQAQLMKALDMQLSSVKGLGVMNERGKTIGVVNEVLTTRDGTYVGLKVRLGGRSGSRGRDVVVPFELAEPVGDAFFLNLSNRDIRNLPTW